MMLGDHEEVLRQGPVGDKACSILHAYHVPRAVRVTSQRVRALAEPKFQEKSCIKSVGRLFFRSRAKRSC